LNLKGITEKRATRGYKRGGYKSPRRWGIEQVMFETDGPADGKHKGQNHNLPESGSGCTVPKTLQAENTQVNPKPLS
jgi:hypothetical protein